MLMSVHRVWVLSNNLIRAEIESMWKKSEMLQTSANTFSLCYNRERYKTYLLAVRLKLPTK